MKIVTLWAVSVLGIGLVAGMSLGAGGARGGGRAGGGRAGAGNVGGAGAAARGGGGAGATGAAARGGAGGAGLGRGNAGGRAWLTAAARIDQREANQQKRIDAGIAKGQLTPDEVSKLQGLETNITTMEANFKSDGKLSKDEVQQLRGALNEASLQIWAERHDTEGNQKPVSRLGRDIFAQDQLTSKIESGDLTKAQAKTFLEDFRKMVNLKRRLATDNLTPVQRTELQGEYNALLNQYFVNK